MKNVQISQELFLALVKYFLLEQEEFLPKIQKGLEQKLDALVMRELYTKYKVALTERRKRKGTKGIFGQTWSVRKFPMVSLFSV